MLAPIPETKDVKRVHVVRSRVGRPCPVGCGEAMWSGEAEDWFEEGVNHLLNHGWVLLHLGQETGGTFGEDTHEDTVAVLGEPVT